MKKLIAVLLTFTMLFTMFTSFSIVTTNAASSTTFDNEKIIWMQDFEKNHTGDGDANWASANGTYASGKRFAAASSGSVTFKDETNNYLSVCPSNTRDDGRIDTAVKVYLDNTKFEVGKKYKVAVDVELDLSSQNTEEEGETRGIYAYILSNTGVTTLSGSHGYTYNYKDGGKGVISTGVFTYTQGMKDNLNARDDAASNSNYTYYYSLNLRVQSSLWAKVEGDKDKFYIDNVRIIEVTEEDIVKPTGEGSVFDDYVLGTVMDFENLSYNTFRHDSTTEGRDTDSNGIKYIVDDPTGAENKVFRGPYVLDTATGATSARTELIGLLANCGNAVGKTYTISFKMYPYGYSNVPITVGVKKNVSTTTYASINQQKNLVEGTDFTPNTWNNIQFDITTTDVDEINFSMHQRSISNGAVMDFTNYDYYPYIYIDDIKITEKVDVTTYFTDINNEENWETDSTDVFTVDTDLIEMAASEGNEELAYTFDGVQGSSMVIGYTAALTSEATDSLPYIAVCDAIGNELAVSKLDADAVDGKIIFNVPNDEDAPGQFTDLTLKLVAGSASAQITDISLESTANPYEITAEDDGEGKIVVNASFGDLSVPESTFTAVALAEGETVTNFTKDMIDLYPSGTATGASNMEIEIDMVDVDDYKSVFSVILYNEENSIYLNVDEVEFINPNFAYTVLGLIQAAGDDTDVAEVVEYVDEDNNITYKEILELDTIEFYEDIATDEDLEIIYLYIYNNKSDIVNGEDTTDLTPLHNIVKKSIAYAMVKNGYGADAFNNFVSDNASALEVSSYTRYLSDADTYSDELFGSFLDDIAADETITTFEDVMEAIEAAMEETPGDLDVYTFFHDMESGLDKLLENGYETGGEGTRELSVVKASDEGITDPYGNSDGHLFKFVSTNSARIKIADIFNPTGVTPRDLGSVYEISFDIYKVEGSPVIRLFSAKDFNANGSFGSSKSSKYATGGGPNISLSGSEYGEWYHVSVDYTLDNLMTTSLGLERGTSYFDNFKVKRVTDNRRVLDSADLQPLDNEDALTLDGVTETEEGYEFTSGGTLKYGVGDVEKQGQKYVAKKDGYYMVTLVAKTNSENALTLTANSSQVQRCSSQLENANDYPNLTTYPVKDVDDFSLVAGNDNEVLVISGGALAEDGTTMINTNGEFKTVNFIFKDTGANGAVDYLGKQMDILRSINITANADDVVVKSMTVKEYNASSPIENAGFDADVAFAGWGTEEVDTSAFANESGVLTITGSAENAGKEMLQTLLLPADSMIELAFTNVDNGAGDALIAAYDIEGNLLSKMEISPAESAETTKVFVFKTPASEGETVPVTLKFIAGESGVNTVDNLAVIDDDNEDYIDLTNYVSYTSYLNTLSSSVRETIIDAVIDDGDYTTGTNFIEAVCDKVVDYRIDNANKNYGVIVDILAENKDFIGLTNWNKVEDVSTKSYYGDVKEEIAKYVLDNGYDTLNDEIEDIIDDVKDNNSSGGGSSSSSSIGANSFPQNVTNTNKVDTTPIVNPDVNFTDLDSVEWARESIETLVAKGVVSGYNDNTFKPNNEITRAEFAKMLVLAFGVYDENATCYQFSDVNSSNWYYSYVATLANLGVTNGMGDGTYGANEKITRQDMVVLIVRMTQLLGKSINATAAEVTFNDNGDIAAYAAEAVKVLQKAEIVSGYEDNTFRPGACATRAQVAKILCALIG